MVAQIVADDGFVQRFHAIRKSGPGEERFAAAHIGLLAFVGMVVGVDRRIVAQQHEEIAVAAVAEIGGGVVTERLLESGEPGLGVFPGVVGAVELVGAEGMVHVGEGGVALAERRPVVGERGELQVAVVAVGEEAGGEVAREAELLGERGRAARHRKALLIGSEAAESRAQAHFPAFGRGRNDVDDAARGIRTVERGAGAAHHLDARDGVHRHRDIHVVVAGLDVVEAHAVEQHEGLLEVGAADGEVGLYAVGRAFLQVERWVEAQHVDDGVEEQRIVADGEHADGAVEFFERHGFEDAGDHHGLGRRAGDLGLILRAEGMRESCKDQQKGNWGAQSLLYRPGAAGDLRPLPNCPLMKLPKLRIVAEVSYCQGPAVGR